MLKPNFTEPPAGITLLYEAFFAVISVPLWMKLAFHVLVIFWLPTKFQTNVQPLIAAEPLFLIVIVTVAPLPQSFAE
jgi:hypothetical protein